jgi:hypothetical protein
MFEDVWFAWGAETVEVGAETIEIGAETVKFGAETDNIFSSSRKCGLHGVPKTTKSKCRKKVPKLVDTIDASIEVMHSFTFSHFLISL